MEEDDELVSTMHILQHANQAGIPVYTINEENKGSLAELDYDSEKISKFESYIDAGREITVPEEEVTISGWSGTGYIVQNEDGTAAYMISGGLAGGFFDDFDIDYTFLIDMVLCTAALLVLAFIVVPVLKKILLLMVAIPFLYKMYPKLMSNLMAGLLNLLAIFNLETTGGKIISGIAANMANSKITEIMIKIADSLTLGYLYNKRLLYV